MDHYSSQVLGDDEAEEECCSSESGWTMYIASSPDHHHEVDDDDENTKERSEGLFFSNDDDDDDDDDDSSMASDASSGHPTLPQLITCGSIITKGSHGSMTDHQYKHAEDVSPPKLSPTENKWVGRKRDGKMHGHVQTGGPKVRKTHKPDAWSG